MDVCRFLNSQDVADHPRGTGYEPSMPEAAFIVYWSCRASLEEKMPAWIEIAETMPDCSMEDPCRVLRQMGLEEHAPLGGRKHAGWEGE